MSRFDRTVWLVSVATLCLIGVVIWRGNHLALRVLTLNPAPAATGVSTESQLQIRLDQPLIADPQRLQLHLTPPLSGTVQAVGDTVRFVPSRAWQAQTIYTVTLAAGLRSQDGRQLRQAVTWHFQTGQLRVLYAALDTINRTQLYVTTLNSSSQGAERQAQQLTFGPDNIWDFAVAPDGNVIYSILEGNGTSHLWTIHPGLDKVNLLVGCPAAVCNDAAPSPSGRWVAYSRRKASALAAGALSPPRLWLLDVQSGQTRAVLNDEQHLGFLPRWSSDEQWLSYVAPDLGGVGVHNVMTGEEHFYPTPAGEPGAWRPGHLQLVITTAQPLGERNALHLVLIDLATGVQQDLSGATSAVEDGAPAWSPDGQWLAFGRKVLTGAQATLGRQLWRMRADGSAATPLTAEPSVDNGPPTWSPDGRYLLFAKLTLQGGTSAVWLYDSQQGQQWAVAQAGQRPLWIP